jgi:ATP-dependent Clp endopeptidase proteolytic subunit ClpP
LEKEAFEMELASKRQVFREWNASDFKEHVYRFTEQVSDKSAQSAIQTLTKWSRYDPKCPITIVFTSPGGDVVAGMALFDFLTELREKGHYITGVTRGYAASMAGILLQACDKRIVGKQSWVLIHEISGGMMGSYGELEDRMKWVERVQDSILDVFAARAAATGSTKTRAQFEKEWERTDWWLSADDCIEWGVCDEIG